MCSREESFLGLLDLANKNTEHPVKIEFRINMNNFLVYVVSEIQI